MDFSIFIWFEKISSLQVGYSLSYNHRFIEIPPDLYSIQRENEPILHIPPRHHAIKIGFPMAGCCVGEPVVGARGGLSLNR